MLRITDGSLKSGLELTQSSFPLLIGALLVCLMIIAALDYFYQRYEHIKSLRMTKQEVKDEYKQTEGSPEVRAKNKTAPNGKRYKIGQAARSIAKHG